MADLSIPAEVDDLIQGLALMTPDLSLLVNNGGGQLLTDLAMMDIATVIPDLRIEICQRRPKIPQKCRCKIPQSRLSVINRIGDRGGAPLVAFRAGVAGVAV